MIDYIWVVIISLGFLFLVAGFLIGLGILAYTALEIKKAVVSIRVFLERAETSINPMIETTDSTIKTIKGISDDIGHITANARTLSDSLNEITVKVREISLLIEGFQKGVSIRGAGLRSGLNAALEVFLKHKSKGGLR